VVRGGFGIFYANLITLGGMQSWRIQPAQPRPHQSVTSAASPEASS
jgi:hypothetical protein